MSDGIIPSIKSGVGKVVDKGKEITNEQIDNAINWAEQQIKSVAPVDMTDPKRVGYPRPENVGNLTGAHSYPSGITGDPLGFVNYMPYPHGKPQAGMRDSHYGGDFGRSVDRSFRDNPLQVNLHMPPDMTDSVSASWETGDDIFAKTGALGLKSALKGTIAEAKESIKYKLSCDVAEVVTKGLLTQEKIKNSMERQRGVVIRPFESQFFKGVDYRSFTFKHKLIAFNEEETKTIDKIVKLFRYHSSPGLASEGIRYEYPASWRIRFFQADPNHSMAVRESEWLPSIKRCVLTSVSVNHFNSNTPSYHENLAPVDIEISLSFKEMEYVTKSSILNETQPEW